MLVTAIIRFLFSSSFSHSNVRKCKQTAQTPPSGATAGATDASRPLLRRQRRCEMSMRNVGAKCRVLSG